jgi:hypothetical protein
MARTVVTFGINKALIRAAKRDGLQVVVRAALWWAALKWFRSKLPGHFEPSAPTKYRGDYTKRTRVYMIRKAKRHHQKPMTWSGAMRRAILKGTPTKELFKSAGALRVRMRLPFARVANIWAGRKRVKSTGEVHNLHRELAAMTDGEITEITRDVERETNNLFQRELEQAQYVTTRFVA